MNQVDGVPDMVSTLYGSVWGRAQKRDHGHRLASGVWSGMKLSPRHSPWCQTFQFLLICHWCPSSCCPGAGDLREWVCVRPKTIVGPLKGGTWESCSFFCHPPPLVFITRSYGDLSSWHWNPGLCGLMWGWDSPLLRYPSGFLSTRHGCGTAHSPPPRLHASAPTTCLEKYDCNSLLLDFHPARFSDNSGWWLFCNVIVIFFCGCVRRRAMLCVSPSRLEVSLLARSLEVWTCTVRSGGTRWCCSVF